MYTMTTINFTDSATESFAKLEEIRQPDSSIKYEVTWKCADSDLTSGAEFSGNEYDKAFKTYRNMLNVVLDSIAKWDNL